jgi:hypothetical protein
MGEVLEMQTGLLPPSALKNSTPHTTSISIAPIPSASTTASASPPPPALWSGDGAVTSDEGMEMQARSILTALNTTTMADVTKPIPQSSPRGLQQINEETRTATIAKPTAAATPKPADAQTDQKHGQTSTPRPPSLRVYQIWYPFHQTRNHSISHIPVLEIRQASTPDLCDARSNDIFQVDRAQRAWTVLTGPNCLQLIDVNGKKTSRTFTQALLDDCMNELRATIGTLTGTNYRRVELFDSFRLKSKDFDESVK